MLKVMIMVFIVIVVLLIFALLIALYMFYINSKRYENTVLDEKNDILQEDLRLDKARKKKIAKLVSEAQEKWQNKKQK